MEKEQVETLRRNCGFPDSCTDTELYETHISWVVLTDNYAFKVKRPVSYSFLDFSTIEKRKHFCELEVELNRKLAPGMYLDVLPVTSDMQVGEPEEEGKEIIDYAVQMERMDNSKKMDNLLREGKVMDDDIRKVATKVAGFHKISKVIKDPFNTTGFQDQYADILSVEEFIIENFGKEWGGKIRECVEASNRYLNRNRSYFNERAITGLRRECHGDLKAGNIFLYDEPVIFDRIEFNEEYRIIDILNDIAFLCVDLDLLGTEDMSDLFYESYLETLGINDDNNSKRLLDYFKGYRANVMAKTRILRIEENDQRENDMQEIRKLLNLMDSYTEAVIE